MKQENDVTPRKVRWGEIYYCEFNVASSNARSQLRPVLVIQNDVGNDHSPTTVVAAISGVMKRMYLPTHIHLDATCGLRDKSMVMLEQVRTVNIATELGAYIGRIRDTATIQEIKRAAAIEMGIIDCPRPKRTRLVLSLCPKCRNEFLRVPENIVRRINHFQIEKERCDKCQIALGYDYVIKKRKVERLHSDGNASGE